jgi:hypothetical protein
MSVPVAMLSKVWVCGHLFARAVVSNPAWGVNVCCECYVLSLEVSATS